MVAMNPYDPISRMTPQSVLTPASALPMMGTSEMMTCPNNESDEDEDASRNAIFDNVEFEAQARSKLVDWGFDADDVSKGGREWYYSHLLPKNTAIDYAQRESRPMVIFAQLGDLSMMRYIMHKSNDPKGELCKSDEYGLFPLYTAISTPHKEANVLEVCQWLHSQGADIRQTVGMEWTALSRACLKGFGRVALWLVSAGALLDDSGSFDANVAKRDLPSCEYYPGDTVCAGRIHQEIFSWANDIVSTRDGFFMFLAGTIPPSQLGNTRQNHRQVIESMITRGNLPEAAVSFLLNNIPDSKLMTFLDMVASPLCILNGFPGITEHIAQYVGVETNKSIICSARGLIEHKKWWDLRQPFAYVELKGGKNVVKTS